MNIAPMIASLIKQSSGTGPHTAPPTPSRLPHRSLYEQIMVERYFWTTQSWNYNTDYR